MDHFERQLTQLMHDTKEHSPFEARHRERLRAGVLARRRVRMARRAAGSVLAVAGLGLGLFLWPSAYGTDRPSPPPLRPAVSPAPTPSTSPTPDVSPSSPPSTTPSSTPTTEVPDPGGTSETSVPPSGTATSLPPTHTANPPDDPSYTPTSTAGPTG